MKKFYLLSALMAGLFVFGCGSQKLIEGENVYEGELIVAGVGPEVTFEPTVKDGTLVLKGYFEDHSDHLFLDESLFLRKKNKRVKSLLWGEFRIPGNIVKFKGVVEALDGAAGNHYYNVKKVDKLEIIRYPNTNEVKDLFDSYNYCESDSDCGYLIGKCPLGCYIPLNIKYINIASNIVGNFVSRLGDEKCVYSCVNLDKSVCKDYKCEMINAEDEEDVHACGGLYDDPNFNTEIECEHIYDPVCGNDGKTYENDCYACGSSLVKTYTFGKCKNSAFVVEGDSKYLREVMDILDSNGAVTCNLSFTNYGKQVHVLFMADKNRFYSAIDDYSDNNTMNQAYTLAMDGKIYYWSTFPDSDNITQDFDIDMESEIASILMDNGKYSDFEMNCSKGIENENLFVIPNFSSTL